MSEATWCAAGTRSADMNQAAIADYLDCCVDLPVVLLQRIITATQHPSTRMIPGYARINTTNVLSGRSLGNVSAMQSTCWVIWGIQGSVRCRVVPANPARRMTGHAMKRTAGKQGSWCTPTWTSSDTHVVLVWGCFLLYSCCKLVDLGATDVACRYGGRCMYCSVQYGDILACWLLRSSIRR